MPLSSLAQNFNQSSLGYREGKIFHSFSYETASEDWVWVSVPELGVGVTGATVNVIPVWQTETHTIIFVPTVPIPVPSIEAEYNASIDIPENPFCVRRQFVGWYLEPTYETLVNWETMPDLTPNEEGNGTILLYGKWEITGYYVMYDANGGTCAPNEMIMDTFKFEQTYSLKKNTFYREGYTFIGWATTRSATTPTYTDEQAVYNLAWNTNQTVILYAVWEPVT